MEENEMLFFEKTEKIDVFHTSTRYVTM